MESFATSASMFSAMSGDKFQTQELEAVRNQYETLLRITESIASHRDLSELFHDLTQLLGNILQFDLEQVKRLKTIFSKPIKTRHAIVLKIAGPYAASVSLLPALLARCRKTHPHSEIAHKVVNLSDVERVIINGDARGKPFKQLSEVRRSSPANRTGLRIWRFWSPTTTGWRANGSFLCWISKLCRWSFPAPAGESA